MIRKKRLYIFCGFVSVLFHFYSDEGKETEKVHSRRHPQAVEHAKTSPTHLQHPIQDANNLKSPPGAMPVVFQYTPEQIACLVSRVNGIPKTNGSYLTSHSFDIAESMAFNKENFRSVRIFLHSSACPKGVVSILEFDKDQNLLRAESCTDTTPEEQQLSNNDYVLPIQHLDPQDNRPVRFGKRFGIAIGDDHYFALLCLSRESVLTRDGAFKVNELGILIYSDDCVVMGRSGENDEEGLIVLKEGDTLDKNGCFSSGPCLSVYSKQDIDPTLVKAVGPFHLELSLSQVLRMPAAEPNGVLQAKYNWEEFIRFGPNGYPGPDGANLLSAETNCSF